MLEFILREIDEEIARLQEAKRLLTSIDGPPKRKRGRPAGSKSAANVASAVSAKPVGRKKRAPLSEEARERIRQAQLKRWAAAKKASK